MRVHMHLLDGWVADKVRTCRTCTNCSDGTAILCGWHENLAAASAAVERVVGQERDR